MDPQGPRELDKDVADEMPPHGPTQLLERGVAAGAAGGWMRELAEDHGPRQLCSLILQILQSWRRRPMARALTCWKPYSAPALAGIPQIREAPAMSVLQLGCSKQR